MVAKPWLRADTLSSKAEIPLINLNFMPMSHVMGRGSLVTALACGGLAYFAASSDMSTLFEDIMLTRPTVVTLVPACATCFSSATATRLNAVPGLIRRPTWPP